MSEQSENKLSLVVHHHYIKELPWEVKMTMDTEEGIYLVNRWLVVGWRRTWVRTGQKTVGGLSAGF